MAKENNIERAFKKRFAQFEQTLNGEKQSKIHKIRKSAISSFLDLGLPTKRTEAYKYTPVVRKIENSFPNISDYTVTGGNEDVNISPYIPEGLEVNLVVFVNGSYQQHLSHINEPELKVTELNKRVTTGSDIITSFFEQAASSNDSFQLLNAAFAHQGVVVEIGNNKLINDPLFILHLNDKSRADNIINTRNLIVLNKGAQATIVESFQNIDNGQSFSNVHSDFFVNAKANVRHVKYANDTGNTIRISSTNVLQELNSVYTSTNIDFGGKLIRNNLEIAQNGEGCESNMFGLFALTENRHVDNHTSLDHKKPNSQSNELYKGILTDTSTGIFNGKIYVRQEAQKTNAFQQNNNILLSDEAVINTKPQLEIWADDVKCSHGCTTGQIDDQQIFYLRSRGLDQVQARAMLLHAFANEVLESIQIDGLREVLDKAVLDQLKVNQE